MNAPPIWSCSVLLLANIEILPEDALEKALKNHTAQRLQKFVEMNIQALRRGGEYRDII